VVIYPTRITKNTN